MSEGQTQYGEAEHERRHAIISRRDASYNGQFFTGVHTTGIYCLPSCAARTPKPQNVTFFASQEAAEQAGLRPCKRCKPDRLRLYEEEAQVAGAIEALRENPNSIRNAQQLADRLGCGLSKLNAICHAYYHATPAHLIVQARYRWACAQLRSGVEASEVGFGCGYESLSAFYEQFRRFSGMPPGDYRSLTKTGSFEIAWPDRFHLATWLAYLGRDPDSECERLAGDRFEIGVHGPSGAGLLTLDLGAEKLRVGFDGDLQPYEAHEAASNLLGLGQDLDGFRILMSQDEADSKLLPEGSVLRIPQTVTVWDGIVWAILGQQVNLVFAGRLRSRLARHAGIQVGENLFTVPSPDRVARLSPEELAPLQFSARKSEYLIGIAGLIADGALDLAALPLGPATRSERTLLELKGIGPWAAHYILMRACGFMDATPLGDTGLTSALQRRFGGDRPAELQTKELMKRYAPYRSLATYHLWQSLRLGVA